MSLSRRQFLQRSSLALGSLALPQLTLALSRTPEYDYILVAEPKPISIIEGTITPALTFNGGYPAPTIRARQGERVRIKFINKLDEPTTIHWHGLRIDIAMDGVPFLSQPPVMPGETFIYDFLCPDAGTFWYHPHMNSLEQLSKGLVGAFIVDEVEPPAFDADIALSFKDWLLDKNGQFKAFTSPRHAARAGTLGNIHTITGLMRPTFDIPAGGAIRARFLNIDNTRNLNISFKDYPATVLAEEGMPVPQSYPLDARLTGAGMRLDVGFIAPAEPGQEVVVYDRRGRLHLELCRFRTVAANNPLRTQVPDLPPNPIVEPDLANAERFSFAFEWAGALSPVKKDGKVNYEFWTINRRAWEGMKPNNLPAPLATLELGKTYIVDLHNATPHIHPIHLHGYSFKVLNSDKREITPYFTDTLLMTKNERAQVAFVADNPGRWMFHCHIIEHMKTGLMGYITVA